MFFRMIHVPIGMAYFLVFLLSFGVAVEAKTLYREQILVIGKVTDNPKKHYRYLRPIVNYAAKQMKDLGIIEARVLMAKDNRQMINYLKEGKVDWITETPFSAVLFEQKGNAEILLRKWKKGVPEYRTIFFTRKESDIYSLSDLKGKSIALQDAGSTSAYFVPASVMIREGLDLVLLPSLRETPTGSAVGYVFAGQEINISTWVFRGLVQAGAFADLDWNKEDHVRKVFRNEMRIFYETEPIPRALELTRKDLDPSIKQRLKTILLNAHNDPKGKKALALYQKTKKFDELDEKGLSALTEVADLLEIVQEKLD